MKRLIPLLILSIVFAACGGDDAADTTTTTAAPPTTVTTTTIAPPTTPPPTTVPPVGGPVWPLTGEPAAAGDPSTAPMLVAKIDNSSSSRPHFGINEADLVVEVLVEGGVPRFLAFYQSELPPVVGPIRSSREVDPKLLAPFEPIYLTSGGQGFVVSAVRRVSTYAGWDVLGNEGYGRASGRPQLYSLVAHPDQLIELWPEDHEPYAEPFLAFSEEAPDGEQALTVEVSQSSYNQVEYRYSAADGGYLRFHGDNPHMSLSALDAEPEQVVATNVAVVYVTVLPTGRTDSAGSPVPDYRVTGEGTAIVFRDGVAIPGTWERGDEGVFFRFFDSAGAEIALAPGTTFIELTPNGRTVEWR